MTWREANLAFTDAVSALNCSVVAAHPWVYGLGQQTENGAYLSPVNAVRYLAEKLAGQGGVADVTIMMVAGQTQDSFMHSLNQMVEVFPSPSFTQVQRLAQSAAQLALEKMQIPAKYNAALQSLPLSIPTSRAALEAAAVKKAQEALQSGMDMTGIKQHLNEFDQLRTDALAKIASGLGELQGKSARAWVFTASGDIATAVTNLLKNIPQQSAVHTAAMMLVGDNLDGLKGLIHDIDPDAGA